MTAPSMNYLTAIEKMTHVARSNVYWPSIDADIADYVK